MWLGHSSSGPEKKRFRDRVPSQLALRDDDSAEIKTKILRIENVRTKLSKTTLKGHLRKQAVDLEVFNTVI